MKAITLQKNHFGFLLDIFESLKNKTTPLSVTKFCPSKQNTEEHFSHTEFLTAITHELKTPLSAILAFAAVLEDEIDNPTAKKDCSSCIVEIKQAASDMSELVHDILDVAQTSSGNFSVDLSQEINLCDVVKRAVRLNYDYSLRRNVALKVEIAEGFKAVKLDARRMKQVLTNLISNAVKYSPAGSEVRIVVKENNHPTSPALGHPLFQRGLEISVVDQGFGMTKEQIKTAFEKYQTIKNPNSGMVDSFGLGLPITKQLVELQNGEIEVTSKVGKGTEMKIKFCL